MDPYALDIAGADAPASLDSVLADHPSYRVAQVRAWLTRGVDDPAEMTDLPIALREQLAEVFDPPPRTVRATVADAGYTHKLLMEFAAGGPAEAVESVCMLTPRDERRKRPGATVCVSTQAGCAMGCPFCATGQAGLRRNLGVGEIIRQVTVMQRLLATGEIGGEQVGPEVLDQVPDHVTNVVFMGMGEPLANLGPTIAAVRWLADPTRFGLSARSITVSTVGLVKGIKRLTALGLPITLAVSLHAPDDELRDDLVPINRVHPLGELLAACREYKAVTNRRLTFEYVLIEGVNDAPSQARRLAALIADMAAHVNLIPMNATPAVPWRAPSPRVQRSFAAVLEGAGVSATIRRTRGADIDAACGQLAADYAIASGRMLPAAAGAAERVLAGRATLAAVTPAPVIPTPAPPARVTP